MNVLKDWEALVSDLRQRVQSGEEACRPLLERAELELGQSRDKGSGKIREMYES